MAKNNFVKIASTNSFLLLVIHVIAAVAGITTKSLPTIIVDNNTDTSQLIQVRSLLEQPTRAFLIQHKTALSPSQQTQILDDVQKNQKVQSSPTTGAVSPEDKRKSLFGSYSPVAASAFPFDSNIFSSIKPIADGRYISGNLSPPPAPTLIFSSQSPQQQQQHPQSYLSAFRPSPNIDLFSTSAADQYDGSFKPDRQVYREFLPSVTAPTPVDSSPNVHLVPSGGGASKVNLDQLFNPSGHSTSPSPYYVLSDSTGRPAVKYQSESSSSNQVTVKPYYKDSSTSKSSTYSNKIPASLFNDAATTAAAAAVQNGERIIKEFYLKTNPEILIAKDRQKFFQQLLGDEKTSEFADSVKTANDQTTAHSDSLSSIKAQFEKELLRQLEAESGRETISKLNIPSSSSALKLLPTNFSGVSEINLSNGQKIQVSKDYSQLLANGGPIGGANDIQTIVVRQDGNGESVVGGTGTTTGKPAEAILAELTKGVLPPGADFELIRHNKDGALEEVGHLPQNLPQKKVTFVILEEQPDGSVKVQGVRGSEKESLKESGEEVDTIIKKIKEGQLKLPPAKSSAYKSGNGKNFSQGGKHETKNSPVNPEYRVKSKPSNADDMNDILRSLKQVEQSRLADKPFLPTPLVSQQQQLEQQSSNSFVKPNYHSVLGSNVHPTNSYPYVGPSSANGNSNIFVQDDKLLAGNYFLQNTVAPLAENSVRGDDSLYGPIQEDTSPNKLGWNFGATYHEDGSGSFPSAASSSTTEKLNEDSNDVYQFYNNSGYFSSLIPNIVPNPTDANNQLPSSPSDVNALQQNQFLPTTVTRDVSTTLAPAVRYTTIIRTQPPGDVAYNVQTTTTANDNKIIENAGYEKNKNKTPPSVPSRKPNKKPDKGTIAAQHYPNQDNEEHESQIEEFTKQRNATGAVILSDLLKKEGFYAMAKFLKQSGLDNILNDTGPFTLFIPTDKAFRTLLIQLGGPDRAEEKFKDNPRLLSGLLLHHVIPGAFRVASLQDEMTGVSLAGTQLRVNTYTTHDIEWNDVKIVTVNGARILDEKDIVIPQGIAHAVDRVMFPLPVGNLLQSLQADRENRYSNFLRILEQSGLTPLLTGSRTFTVFAPLNRALSNSDFTKLSTNQKEAKTFILKHIVPGALYSAGMKYYQVRESMDNSQQITIYKEAGRIKVNSAHVVTRNIPSTNGVIHAIDSIL